MRSLCASCLASQFQGAHIRHLDDGLDIQQASCKGHGGRDSAAALQVFQGVNGTHDPDLCPKDIQTLGNFARSHAHVHQIQCRLRQNADADGGVEAVYYADLSMEVFRGDQGALVSTGETRGQGDAHRLVVLFQDLFKHRLISIGGDLAGGGKVLRSGQQAIEIVGGKLHPVDIFLIPKADHHVHTFNSCSGFRRKVCGGIHNDFYAHFVSSL